MNNILKSILTIGIVIFIGGCGGGGSNNYPQNSNSPTEPQNKLTKIGTGTYVDAPVEGLSYECGDIIDVTNEKGEFDYEIGKKCVFKIGDLIVRVVSGDILNKDGVLIQETNPKVAQLLLSLNQSNSDKLIKIDRVLAKEFRGSSFKKDIKEIQDIKTLIESVSEKLRKKGIKVSINIVEESKAKEHLKSSFQIYSNKRGFTPIDKDEFVQMGGEVKFQSNSKGEGKTASSKKSSQEGKDKVAPKITLNGSSYLTIELGSKYTESGAIAKDDVDGLLKVTISGYVDTSKVGKYTINYTATDKAGNTSVVTRIVEVVSSNPYYYLPEKNQLTDKMAVKFLNMATFGATPKLVDELKSKGVENWVNEQLNMKYDEKRESILRRLIKTLTTIEPNYYSKKSVTVDEWIEDNNGYYFNQGKRNGPDELSHHYSKVFDAHMRYQDQLRQRVAYALSQIIVVSQSNDQFFRDRGEALSYYYDILQKRAFGNYADLLYDISMSPAMATFLTYANNKKEYIDQNTGAKILPDENYGREIMQLFTIGLYELNMDGTEKRGDGGKRIPTYSQVDVNNLSRVFTGLTYPHTKFGSTLLKGDTTHPLTCHMDYHDTGEKRVLGETLPAGQNCEQDVKSAIDLLMNHPNVAPFVAKKLIMRLTKSNPTTAYVQRVAEVFANSGGNLKETVKAILLDPEIWEDIKSDKGVKIKEPYLAFTGTLRALDAKPLPYTIWRNGERDYIKVSNDGFFSFSLYDSLGEWVTNSPTVFNFYDDEFVPDDYEFKIRGFVAPELEIITNKYNVAFNNTLNDILVYNSIPVRVNDRGKYPEDDPNLYHSHNVYLSISYKDIIDVFKNNGFGKELDKGTDSATKEKVATKVIDYLAIKLLGAPLPQDQRELLINKYKTKNWIKRGSHSLIYMEKFLVLNWIRNLILDITHTDNFMVQ